MGREKSGTSRKQFMLLEGAPILIHTIRKFLRCPSVTEIVVALRAEDMDWARGLIHQEHPSKPVRIVEGGETRQESVENALASLADTDLVAVHDAVRPFIEPELVEKVIAEAAKTGAAIVGIVPVDTIKQVHKNKIRATLSREHLVMAQTPQVFRFDLLQRAVSAFEREHTRTRSLPAWGAADAFTDLAHDYLTQGDAVAARNVLERALLVAPHFAEARQLMAEIVSG